VASLGDGGAGASPVAPERAPVGGHVGAVPPAPNEPTPTPAPRSRPLVDASRPARSRAKRGLDLGVALATAPVTVPLGLLCALLIKISSRGPVLFRQERIGLDGRSFAMYKFRTMRADAEARLNADPDLWQQYVENDYKLPVSVDTRVTAVGRFLRRSSLDELPQVINVLLGTMTLVGPRPVVPAEIDNYGDQRGVYLSVRPGITGAWQVNGRSTVDYPARVEIDAEYVRTWSLWLDLKILARTPFAVVSARGAF
jgi:exopolysaccharide production protein ExoY